MPRVRLTGDGRDVTARGGTQLLGLFALRFGVTTGLAAAIAGTTIRSWAHDPGTVLTQLTMMIAAGSRAVTDSDDVAGSAAPVRARSCPA